MHVKAVHAKFHRALDVAQRVVDEYRARRVDPVAAAQQRINLPLRLDHMLVAGDDSAVKQITKVILELDAQALVALLRVVGEQIELLARAFAAPRRAPALLNRGLELDPALQRVQIVRFLPAGLGRKAARRLGIGHRAAVKARPVRPLVDVAEHVLLPLAEELGLPFSLLDLKVYETKKKARYHQDVALTEEELAQPLE